MCIDDSAASYFSHYQVCLGSQYHTSSISINNGCSGVGKIEITTKEVVK
jgi:hypothetical protein